MHAAMQPPEQRGPERRHRGCRRTLGARVPWLAPLATALLRWAVGQAWVASLVVPSPVLACKRTFLFISFAYFCITLSALRLLHGFVYFPLVFECVSCKTCFIHYKWNYVNSKGICVKRFFISPILDNNWRSNVVVSDRQQAHEGSQRKQLVMSQKKSQKKRSYQIEEYISTKNTTHLYCFDLRV